MIKEEDIKVGLRLGLYETVEKCGKRYKHEVKDLFDMTCDKEAPSSFEVAYIDDDGYVILISKEILIEYGAPFYLVIHKKKLSPISYEWPDVERRPFDFDKSAVERAMAKADAMSDLKKEQVEHPSHYAWLKELCGVEPIDICRHFGFSVGNALKYLMRKGKVDGDKTETEKRVEDLKKAAWYLQDEIRRLEDGK